MPHEKPSFTIERDKVGLGDCVIAIWPDGRREVVTGFGTEKDAQDWIDQDSARWLAGPPSDNVAKYQKKSDECRAHAAKATNEPDRRAWLRLADEWLKLLREAAN